MRTAARAHERGQEKAKRNYATKSQRNPHAPPGQAGRRNLASG
jgi:hypothetical protein